jgi:hypothetical protein
MFIVLFYIKNNLIHF